MVEHNNNDKWTKEDTIFLIKFYTFIAGLIIAACFIGNALGIPEFQF